MKSIRRAAAMALAAVLLCVLSGCRIRTGIETRSEDFTGAQAGTDMAAGRGEGTGAEADAEIEPGTEDSGGTTKENPDAYRKEYDENAPAEIAAGTEHLLHGEGEGSGTPADDPEAEDRVSRLNDETGESALMTVAAEEAEDTGVSEEGKEAETALTYFTVLLKDRRESLYICQQPRVYWETAEEYVTIHRSDSAHQIILGAGAEDVSERLKPDSLGVDDGWVARKNPDVIVRIVDRGILGSGVTTPGAAQEILRRMKSRSGWGNIEAVRNGRVVLLSEELMEAPYLQVFAMLLIAGTAEPSLFDEISPEKALEMLMQEATGLTPEGIFYYTDREDGP